MYLDRFRYNPIELVIFEVVKNNQVQALDLGSSPAAMQLLDTSENSETKTNADQERLCVRKTEVV